MRFLFIHPNFPAQFANMLIALSQAPGNQVAFLTTRTDGEIPGVHKVIYQLSREVAKETHQYVRNLEEAVLHGQAAYRAAVELKNKGFVPDLVVGHSGWGPTMYMKDLFPDTPFIGYFEWFYHAHGSDAEFGPDEKLNPDAECRIRSKNAPILIDLYSCDRGYSPTYWQHSQFPAEYARKIQVIHDGINTEVYQPKKDAALMLADKQIDLSGVDEVITYVARGMEPYRGFPQFMESLSLVMARRPRCHAVIVGEDRVAYGSPAPGGKSFKELTLERFPFDPARLHFTGHLPRSQYLQVLQASTVHVYLTRPFVLSWSMLEAMSCGCLLVASDTQPVREVINDGVNGLLVDFFRTAQIADRIEEALDDPRRRAAIGVRARESIRDRYELKSMLARQAQFFSATIQEYKK
ncbi:MAG TPA: glycosyltransferase family 4 protein [Patescibacteria group bacterium]|nr:glycosyltransferase family 4 protein [Patescibacteria group bacterium]